LARPSLFAGVRGSILTMIDHVVVAGVPCPSQSLTDLGTLPSDCPIFDVITMPEVITLGITISFDTVRSSQNLRSFPFYKTPCPNLLGLAVLLVPLGQLFYP
jgi:hypothetical protein